MKARRPDWRGRTVVCLASGPSLTPEDVDLVKASGHPVIVTNATFRLAPWADVLFGFDFKFWREYHDEALREFRGQCVSHSALAVRYGVATTNGSEWFRGFGNSGVCAIAYAVGGRAARVVLMGFDCAFGADGKKHWHGNHDHGLSNCLSIARWPQQFDRVATMARRERVHVVNASRRTALKCFERKPLEDVL